MKVNDPHLHHKAHRSMIRQTANTALSLACYGGSTAIVAYILWAAPAALVIMLAIAWCVALLAMGTDQ